MGSRLAVLALASMWWMGCSDGPPATGPGGSGGVSMADAERAQRCQDLCSGVVGDSPRFSCLNACVSVVLYTDFKHWVLAGAQATVKIRQTYGFGFVFNDQQLLTSCDIGGYVEGTEEIYSAFTNFSLAVPRESADYFSFTSVPDTGAGDTVIWGLYDQSTGEEWSGDPGGLVHIGCNVLPESAVMSCKINWYGNATENFDTEHDHAVPSSVRIRCLFVAPEDAGVVACFDMGCHDQNPCTDDLCGPDGCGHYPRVDGTECDFDPGFAEVPGVCAQGACEPSPCGQFCAFGDVCTVGICDTETGDCDTYPILSSSCGEGDD